MALTEFQINTNYTRWQQRLEKYNCSSPQLVADLGELIKNAPWARDAESGGAYDGALLDVVMNHLCLLGHKFNTVALTDPKTQSNAHPYIQVSPDMLMRVLLLQHIAKAELYITQREAWKAKKGMLFEFNPDIETTLKVGERSLFLCQKYGIKLTEDEFDAIRVIDKADELSTLAYINPLAQMVKSVNQFANLEIRRRWEYSQKTTQSATEQ